MELRAGREKRRCRARIPQAESDPLDKGEERLEAGEIAHTTEAQRRKDGSPLRQASSSEQPDPRRKKEGKMMRLER